MHTVCMYVLRVHWRFFNPVMLWRLFAPWLKTGVAAGEGLGAIVLRTAEGGGLAAAIPPSANTLVFSGCR